MTLPQHSHAVLIAIHNDILLPQEVDVQEADTLPATAPRVYTLQDGICTIGRDREKCQIWVRPERVDISRIHAHVVQIQEQFVLANKQTTNGTFVNNQRIEEPYTLKSNDVIGLAYPSEMLRFIGPSQRQRTTSVELGLTERERDVLRHLVRGQSYKDIAQLLHISDNTVKTHLQHIYAKLGVNDRDAAADLARTLNLL